MKTRRYLPIILLTALFLPPEAHACEIHFDPASLSGKAGATVEVKAIVIWEHRNCVLDDDDVTVDITNGALVSQTGWKKIKRGEFHNTLKIKLLKKGETKVDVHRHCSKKGTSRGVLMIKVE